MPPVQIGVNDVVEVQFAYLYQSQNYFSVMHYQCINLPTDREYVAAITELLTHILSDATTGMLVPLLPLLGEDCTVSYFQGQRVYPGRDFYIRETVNTSGSGGADSISGNVACSIAKQSDTAGRGRSGHFQLPCPPVGAQSSGGFTNAYLTDAEVFANALKRPQVAGTGGTSIWKPGMFTKGAGIGTNFHGIVGVTAQREIRTMHRRTLGLGI